MLWLANSGSSSAAPQDDFWYEPAQRGWQQAAAGASGMLLSAVYRCVHVLGETMGQMPLILYRRLPGGGKERAIQHPLYRLLAEQPNGLQTSMEWRETLQGHLELRGNAYARLEFDGLRVSALWPMHPDRVKIELLPGSQRLRYTWTPNGAEPRILNQDEVLHLRGLSSDGVMGLNPIEIQRRTLGNAAAAEQFGERVFTSDATLGGWIEHPNNFADKEKRENYRNAWREQVRSGGVPILEYGLKYHEVGMKLTDAQFIETRKYNAAEIASRIFGVPPHKIGIMDKATWANIESQNIEFVTEAIVSRARRWEQRLNITLLSDAERGEFFFEYLIDSLLRGDSTSRAAFYEKMLKNRVMSPNEVRSRENLNPASWGDEPLPMPNESVRGGNPNDGDRSAALERGAAQAVVQKEQHQLRTLAGKLEGAALAAAVQTFYAEELAPFAARVLSVSPPAALRYAADSAAAVNLALSENRLAPMLDEWKSRRAEQLLEILHAP